METILFVLLLALSLVGWFITLIIYFIHDDLKKGRTPFMESWQSFLNMEIVIHILITVLLWYD